MPSNDNFADTPDVWCRRLPPASDPGASPGNYATTGPHEDPLPGQSNWIYARVHNKGTRPSPDAWIRVSVSHFPGMEFAYPTSFQPSNGPGALLPTPMTPGTYFIGEAKVSAVPVGGEQIVTIEWKPDLIPPAQVPTPAGLVQWHPCLLAEITPHDGLAPTGSHVWDDNNLAQKNISIVSASTGSDFGMVIIMGNGDNDGEFLLLEVLRGQLSHDVQLYLDLIDLPLPHAPPATDSAEWRVGQLNGRKLMLLAALPQVRIPIPAKASRLSPVVVGGVVGSGAHRGVYEIRLMQRQPTGHVSGAATLSLTIGDHVRVAAA